VQPIRHAILRLTVALAALAIPASAATLNVPAQYPTIQSGINAANTGDTVLVAPGTYYENIDFKGKAITVTSSAGAASTIIDGGGGAVASFVTSETRASVLSGLTITHGGSAGTSPHTGGIYIYEADPTIANNIITTNYCYGIYLNTGDALIQNNDVASTITDPSLSNCFIDASGIFLGGIIAVTNTYNSSIIGNTIENNHAAGGYAGGIMINGTEGVFIKDNIIRNNSGINAGGILSYNTEQLSIIQNLIYDNIASVGPAGGISIVSPSYPRSAYTSVIASNDLVANIAQGSPNTPASELDVEGNLADYVISNNIMDGASSTHAEMTCSIVGPTPPYIDHNIIYNAQGTAYDPIACTNAGSLYNPSVDPLFVATSTFNFHLTAASPAIDHGDDSAPSLPALDLDGNPRVANATNQSQAIIDMGVYEFSGTVGPASTTTLTSSLNPAGLGVPVTFTATVTSTSGTPTGSVTFSDGTTTLGTVTLLAGAAPLTTSSLGTGAHTITATYNPTGSYTGSSANLTQTVIGISTHTSLFANASAYAGNNAPFGVTVNLTGAGPAPTGTISLMEGATVLTTTPLIVSSGPSYGANPTLSNLSVGPHTITAVYSGDTTYNTSTSNPVTVTILINPTTLTLTSSINPSHTLQTVTFTAQLASTTTATIPTGTITLTISGPSATGGGSLTTNSSGAAHYSTMFLANTATITATFTPTAIFGASSDTLMQQTIADATVTTLTATPNPVAQNQTVTLNATVTAASSPFPPGGGIIFYDGSTVLDTVLGAPGQASFTTSSLAVGTHTLTASYIGGGLNYLLSTSAPVSLVVNPQYYTLSTAPAISIQAEHHANLAITLTSVGGFTDDIALSCGSLPVVATCTFANSTVHLAPNATVTTSVLLDTDAVPEFKSSLRRPVFFTPSNSVILAMLLPLGLLALRRRSLSRLLLLLLAAAALSITGCSGKYPAHTPPGAYAITLTGHGVGTGLNQTGNITFIVTE
jgi:hypothetical protein